MPVDSNHSLHHVPLGKLHLSLTTKVNHVSFFVNSTTLFPNCIYVKSNPPCTLRLSVYVNPTSVHKAFLYVNPSSLHITSLFM